MGLFKPVWMTDVYRKKDKACEAVRMMSDQSELARVAREAPLSEVRVEAVKKIDDQDLLVSIANDFSSEEVCIAAIGKLSDENALASIVMRCGNWHLDVRKAAFDGIRSQGVLADIAIGATYGSRSMGISAAGRMTSVAELKRVCKDAQDHEVRDAASKRLIQLELAEAERRISEASSQEELARMAEDQTAGDALRKAAAQSVTDQGILKRWAIQYPPTTFLCMPERIESTADLIEIARDAKDGRTSIAAIELIDDEAILADMAGEGWSAAARKLGGYVCGSCHEAVLPEDGNPVPCACPGCGARNHDWEHYNGEIVHRDYSSGTSYDYCKRCGEKKNIISHDTW